MGSKSKPLRPKKESNHQTRVEVRISELPDAVLCHMLSFLATNYAARTSILSTRWKNIWASVPNLDFEYKDGSIYKGQKIKPHSVRFSTFVDRVLSFRDSSDIKKIRLHCSYLVKDLSRIDSWIHTVVSHNVVELDLLLYVYYKQSRTFQLPQRLFMCKTLVLLKVTSDCITYAPPTSGCFPSLKFLHVTVTYPDNESMEKLFSSCPVVQDFTIAGILGDDIVLNFKVSAPELKTLRIDLVDEAYPEAHEYNFFINAPKLENLDLRQDILSNYLLENSKSLVKANVEFYFHHAELLDDFSNRATMLLAKVSNTKYLSLPSNFLAACCVPAFDNLIQLKLVLHDCYNWELLTELLKRSPMLEHRVLEHKDDGVEYSEDEEYLEDEEYSENENTLRMKNTGRMKNSRRMKNTQRMGGIHQNLCLLVCCHASRLSP